MRPRSDVLGRWDLGGRLRRCETRDGPFRATRIPTCSSILNRETNTKTSPLDNRSSNLFSNAPTWRLLMPARLGLGPARIASGGVGSSTHTQASCHFFPTPAGHAQYGQEISHQSILLRPWLHRTLHKRSCTCTCAPVRSPDATCSARSCRISLTNLHTLAETPIPLQAPWTLNHLRKRNIATPLPGLRTRLGGQTPGPPNVFVACLPQLVRGLCCSNPTFELRLAASREQVGTLLRGVVPLRFEIASRFAARCCVRIRDAAYCTNARFLDFAL
ncbi:hypothetical protein P171DRAFT_255626 [Karstenula rhodostoma CBS 690.94]|uniref:Uncharacterized protein n=1 Tax=Karstenula rhodostoma CBS 690.94 TaxID=1392251 RepID=A0A9P4UDK1_9PLEO|nr:hypothetical protein P171DRAFT_255626 [Karstenula rhodostoma CBS 690.94]